MKSHDPVLEGEVAIVTGAGRGIGRVHALALARSGAAIVVNDFGGGLRGESDADAAPAEAVAAEIRAAGGRAIANTADIGEWTSGRRIVESAIAEFGRLDIVVNNAGICRFAAVDEMTREDWERTIAVNLTSTAALAQAAAAHWRELGPAPGRAIVNTSSPAGTNPAPGSTSYCASKAGVAAFTIAAAIELATLGVRVNAIAPMARTRMTLAVPALDEIMRPVDTGFDRVAPEHVSPLVVYLASPRCRFTGRLFGIEGDDLFLFEGWSAEHHFNNRGRPWSLDTLERALADVDRQDRGFLIAPSARIPGPAPSDATLAELEAVAAPNGANGASAANAPDAPHAARKS
jgi:NAD(P)-dependent dehydrogenase (short-subunit alcohol dehydrogenase family)